MYVGQLAEGAGGAAGGTRDALSYGGTLGELTREYLSKVAALAGRKSVIVEASGHADDNLGDAHVQVTVRLLTTR